MNQGRMKVHEERQGHAKVIKKGWEWDMRGRKAMSCGWLVSKMRGD